MTHFSVVIPTYNRAGLIGETLASVLAQQAADFELIVVDDASTDATQAVLATYLDSGKLTTLRNDQNRERAHSRNRGMDTATGNWLTFLDSDDHFRPGLLAAATQYIDQNPTSRLFHAPYRLVNPQGELVNKPPLPDLTDPLRAISEGNFLSNIGLFIHRDLYQQIRFDEHPDLVGAEDYDFNLRVIAAAGQLGRLEGVYCEMVDHPGRSVQADQLEKGERRTAYFEQKLETDPVLSTAYRPYHPQILATLRIYMAYMARLAGSKAAARSWLRKTRAAWPGIRRKRAYWSLRLWAR